MLSVVCVWWTCNAKLIGLLYIYLGVCFGVVGYIISWILRGELGGSSEQWLFGDGQYYNQLITAHAMVMIFFFVMPTVLSGCGNLLCPLLSGVPEMVFPRVNNIGLWLVPVAFMVLIGSGVFAEGCGTGWTMYPPLAMTSSHGGLGVDIFILALHTVGLSSITGGINILCTVCYARRAQLVMLSVPLYCWSIFYTAILLILVVPVLAAAITLQLSDRLLGTVYYDVAAGGDCVMYQHLFWVFGHPEVYIIILPVFGLVSTVTASSSRFSQFNVLGMIYAMASISVVGFFVWAHHMFLAGMDNDTRVYFSSVTLLIALPTAIKVFSWLVCLLRCVLVDVVVFVVLGFVGMFVLGGITGLTLGTSHHAAPCHDAYFVVGHFHYVLSLGAVFGFVCGVFVLFMWISGITVLEGIGRFLLCLLVVGSNGVFWSMHTLGLGGAARRMSVYCDQFFFGCVVVSTGLTSVLFFLVGLFVLFGCGTSTQWCTAGSSTIDLTYREIMVATGSDILVAPYPVSHCYATEVCTYGLWVQP